MEIKKPKFNKDLALGLGLTTLSIVQLILNGKKETREKEILKAEVTKDVLNSLSQNKEG